MRFKVHIGDKPGDNQLKSFKSVLNEIGLVKKVRSIGEVFGYFFKEGSWFEDLDGQRHIHD